MKDWHSLNDGIMLLLDCNLFYSNMPWRRHFICKQMQYLWLSLRGQANTCCKCWVLKSRREYRQTIRAFVLSIPHHRARPLSIFKLWEQRYKTQHSFSLGTWFWWECRVTGLKLVGGSARATAELITKPRNHRRHGGSCTIELLDAVSNTKTLSQEVSGLEWNQPAVDRVICIVLKMDFVFWFCNAAAILVNGYN